MSERECADSINSRQISLFSWCARQLCQVVHSEHGPLMRISGSMSGRLGFKGLDLPRLEVAIRSQQNMCLKPVQVGACSCQGVGSYANARQYMAKASVTHFCRVKGIREVIPMHVYFQAILMLLKVPTWYYQVAASFFRFYSSFPNSFVHPQKMSRFGLPSLFLWGP
jgi:hypothetical protein